MTCRAFAIDGGVGFLCGPKNRRAAPCYACQTPHTRLCDGPSLAPGGESCDRPMCEAHSHHAGEDRDLCEQHFRADGPSESTMSSDLKEKLEHRKSSSGPARCTLAQLEAQFGTVSKPEVIAVGSRVERWSMGVKETWRVSSKDGSNWTLEKIS